MNPLFLSTFTFNIQMSLSINPIKHANNCCNLFSPYNDLVTIIQKKNNKKNKS